MKENRMGQKGFAKIIVVLVLCLIIASGTYLGLHHANANAPTAKAKQVAASQTVVQPVVKVDEGKQLQTKLEAAWQQTLTANHPDGNVDVALYDNATGVTAHYAVGSGPFVTASTMKLSILETLLWHDQQNGLSGLTSDELSEATPMIENSDNDSADELYLTAGGSSGLNNFFKQIGASGTRASGPWGITQTTAIDQLQVIGQVAYPKLLTGASANQANSLMDQIEADQRWGVSGGVPSGVSVQLKNGWLSDEDIDGSDNNWNVNSVGHVHGNGADYTIAVLTNGDSTLQDGINTIQALSTDAWNAVSKSTVSN